MVFSSLLFMFVYFALVLAVYYVIPRKVKNLWLFIVSILFYGFGEPVYVFLMLFSITGNYVAGLLLDKWKDKIKAKRTVLVLDVIFNLGMLGFFKYTGFVLGMFDSIPAVAELQIPEIALPIGISFNTFQTMSYIIDLYWGNCKVQKNYITFGTYVVLFPQLIAGPIVRYVDVEYQLQYRKETPGLFTKGVKLFVLGLAKKVLIAVIENDVDPIAFCKENGLDKKVDNSVIESVLDKAISDNPKAVEDFKNGKTKAMQALFGACMRELKGAGDPAVIKELLEQKLKAL